MKVNGKQWVGVFFLSFLTCFVLGSSDFVEVPLFFNTASVYSIPFLAGTAFLYRAAFFPFEKRRFLISGITGFLMGLMVFLGTGYSLDLTLTRTFPAFLSVIAALTLLFGALISLFLLLLSRLAEAEAVHAVNDTKKGRIGNVSGKMLWLFLFLSFFLFYTPVFLAVYPGIYSYDASIQIMQVFGSLPLTTHHPLFHTWFLCGSLKLGNLLFGSYQAGMAIYSVLQSLFLAAVFSLVIVRMAKRKAPVWLLFCSWLFLAVNPYLSVFAFVTTKDVIFGAFFLLAFDGAAQMAAAPKRFFSSFSKMAFFFLSAAFMCFFRNQGIYVFLFFSFFYFLRLLVLRSQEKPALFCRLVVRWICGTLVVVFFSFLAGNLLPSALGVEKGDMKEMLCVPMQQLARVYNESPEQLNEKETSYIESLIDPIALDNYIRVNADPVKAGFRTDVLKEDPGRFIKIWCSVGLKAPRFYLDSFFMGNWGYWYPGASQYWIHYILFDGAFMEESANILNITRDSHFPQYEALLREITLTPEFEKVPGLSLILNQAFPFWLMLLAGAVLIYRKEGRMLCCLSLILGYWGTLLLGPVTSVRYALPLMFAVPILMELIFSPGIRIEDDDLQP